MKSKIEQSLRAVSLACFILGFAIAASADVIRQTVSYPTNVLAGFHSIDFDGDGTTELSFESYGITFGSGGSIILDVHSSQSAQVLLQDWRVLPLYSGETVSLIPVIGQWQMTGYGNSVWTAGLLSSPDEPPPPPGQGVGMPGYGDFMGVRFLAGSDWHYAWVRFDPLNSAPLLGWPSVVEYGYESFPDTPIVVPEPSTCALILSGCALLCFYVRQKGMA